MTAGISRQIVMHDSRKSNTIFLAFIWVCGLFFGVNLSDSAGSDFVSLMRGASRCSVSIVCLLSVSLLPFFFSAFAVYIRSFRFLAALCFIKGCLFAFISAGIFLAFKDAGWLLRLLMMFSDLFCLVPLWWCWISLITGGPQGRFGPVWKGSLVALGIVCLDFCFVSPFLAKLVEY